MSLMAFPLWVAQPFSLAAFRIFSFISTLVTLMIMCLGVALLEEYLCGIPVYICKYLYFLDLNIGLPCLVGEVFLDSILKSIFQLGLFLSVTFRYTYQT